jgi:hypothetical protein
MRALPLMPALLLVGCTLGSLSPAGRLNDTVHALNDMTRWTRLDLAAQGVAPQYRRAFRHRRQDWGRDLRVASTDVVDIAMTDDRAVSIVALEWWDYRTMEVYGSTLRQEWEATDDGFLLTDETVVEGEERLFAELPEGMAEAPEEDDTVSPED